MTPTVFLSRRNLLSLLSKLDRAAAGEQTECAIIKNDDAHPVYAQTLPSILVQAVEDAAYYEYRRAGVVHPLDDPDNKVTQ